jgi:2-keto-4-pentenoate hydratase/2-oxohepta-3-ene-1,7-dioic acid hydratase in catechol pathway
MNSIDFNGKKITPSKVICIGRNYVEHIHELNNEIPENMVVFNKPNSSIVQHLEYHTEDTRFESEICLLIENGEIAGIGLGLDLTKANIQNKLKKAGLPWERAKGFDGAAVLSKFVPFNGDITKIGHKLFINDKLQQESTYDLMIYKPQEMLEEIKSFMSIEDGDIIMTGTPKGVSTYNECDLFQLQLTCDEEVLLSVVWEAM